MQATPCSILTFPAGACWHFAQDEQPAGQQQQQQGPQRRRELGDAGRQGAWLLQLVAPGEEEAVADMLWPSFDLAGTGAQASATDILIATAAIESGVLDAVLEATQRVKGHQASVHMGTGKQQHGIM